MTKIEIELPEFDGFEYTGEYRRPTTNEYFLNRYGEAEQVYVQVSDIMRPILKPKPKTVPKKITWKRISRFREKYGECPRAIFGDGGNIRVEGYLKDLTFSNRYEERYGPMWWDECEIIDERWPQKEVSE